MKALLLEILELAVAVLDLAIVVAALLLTFHAWLDGDYPRATFWLVVYVFMQLREQKA